MGHLEELVEDEDSAIVYYLPHHGVYRQEKSLKQLAIDDGDKYPLAAEVIMSDVYMDDLLTGANDLESGRKLKCNSFQCKIPGLLWKPHPDSFAFKISPMTSNCDNFIVTKKSSLWQLKLDWNDLLPSSLVSYWKSFIDALESINCPTLQDKSIRTELHGFSDSSEKAYGAALYLR
ncbi:uncharacterized protein TNCV_1737861 [Trichonephila clavipes]|nr:uncharacterized protein TNCV_1737861 [Trichonephila clavipes]